MIQNENTSAIQKITIREVDGGAQVDLTIADESTIEDSEIFSEELEEPEEFVVISVRVEYEREYPRLEEVKRAALLRARTVIGNETRRIQSIRGLDD